MSDGETKPPSESVSDSEVMEKLKADLETVRRQTDQYSQVIQNELSFLTPDYELDFSDFDLAVAMAVAESIQKDEDIDPDFDWQQQHLTRSGLATEVRKISARIDELRAEAQSLETRLRDMERERRQQRLSLEQVDYFYRERFFHRINRRIRGAFLGARTYFEGFTERNISEQIVQIQTQIEALQVDLENVQAADQKFEQRIFNHFNSSLVGNFTQIQRLWGEYAQGVTSSEWVDQEITTEYLDRRITPRLQRLVDEERITPDRREEFLAELEVFLQARAEGNSEKIDESWKRIQEFSTISYDFSRELNFLLNRGDVSMIDGFISQIAYDQLSPLLFEIRSTAGQGRSYDVRRTIDYYLRPDSWAAERDGRPNFRIQPHSFDDGISENNLESLSLLKRSESAKFFYGDSLKELDLRVYQQLLEESLTDLEGGFIDGLFYYPTPDVIKQLIILAATDRVRYRNCHANWVFTSLAEQEEWPALLDHAAAGFAEISPVVDLLRDWSFTEQHRHHAIQPLANKLALRVLHDESEHELLRELARNALTNQSYIAELVGRDLIDQKSLDVYQQAHELMSGIANQSVADVDSPEAQEARDFGHALWSWEYSVRSVLKQIHHGGKEHQDYPQLLEEFHRSTYLGSLWFEFKDNKEKLAFMSSYLTIGLLKEDDEGRSATAEQLKLLSEAYDTYSALTGELSYPITQVFKHSPEYFITQEGFIFLQKFSDTYEQEDHSSSALEAILIKVSEGKLTQENSLSIYQKAEGVLSDALVAQFPDLFATDEGVSFLQKFKQAYLEGNYAGEVLQKILSAVGSEKLTQGQALELHSQAADLLDNHLVLEYPDLFLSGAESQQFARDFLKAAEKSKLPYSDRENAVKSILGQRISKEFALLYIRILPSLFSKEQESLRNYIFKNSELIATNESDLKFLSRLLGMHGGKAFELLKEYTACVKDEVVTAENRDKVLEFTKRFRVLSPAIVEGYLEADKAGMVEGYIAELNQVSERMISSEPFSEDDRSKVYFGDLVRAVYPNHSNSWATYKSNESCNDRMSDLEGFVYESRYEIDLLSAAEVRVRDGETIDEAGIESLKHDILSLQSESELEKLQAELEADIDDSIEKVRTAGGLVGVDTARLQNLDEKLFVLLADSVYGDGHVSTKDLKKLILRYEFAFFDDIRDYIQGTTDRVGQASNPEYALMCELHSFFADRIKEINRRLARVGWENESIRQAMPVYFERLARERAQAQAADQLNRLRVDRLGLSDSFIQQISRNLERRRGKKYSPETVVRLIERYESIAQGLVASTSSSEKKDTKAFYGQLRSQREKTLAAIEAITGERVDPQDYHLGDVNLEDLAVSLAEVDVEAYDEEQFQAFTALRFLNLFADERNLLESELDKFESESGKQRQVVNGFFTKTKVSANARMVGGECVSGDNPETKIGHKTQEGMNMWDSSNFFQFVLQDPETHRCQGLVMLHHFEEDGQKVLAASFNPSSTFLYSTDEASLFEGLMSQLENFAINNDFDKILMSQNGTIRTNRTGGAFERAMNARRQQVDKTFSFSEEQVFSYSPSYKLKDMDVIWERE